jgi:hypothetical protein
MEDAMRGHVGDVRGNVESRFGNDLARQGGTIKPNTRAEMEAVQAAVYRVADDQDTRRELMMMLFAPTNPTQLDSRTNRRKVTTGGTA